MRVKTLRLIDPVMAQGHHTLVDSRGSINFKDGVASVEADRADEFVRTRGHEVEYVTGKPEPPKAPEPDAPPAVAPDPDPDPAPDVAPKTEANAHKPKKGEGKPTEKKPTK
jgi:hypothetical protein